MGGEEGSELKSSSAELYDPSTGEFSPAGRMHSKDLTTAVLLKNGEVLVIGPSSSDLYNPSGGGFSVTGHLQMSRAKFDAALLPDGKVLVAGGQVNGAWGERVSVTEIHDPASGSFSAGPDMDYKRFNLKKSVVTLKNGRVLIGGGAGVNHAWFYQP